MQHSRPAETLTTQDLINVLRRSRLETCDTYLTFTLTLVCNYWHLITLRGEIIS